MAQRESQSRRFSMALSNVLADVSELVRQEMRLAWAEISQQLKRDAQGAVSKAIAIALLYLALMLLAEAAVFAIWSAGLAAHYSCLIAAGAAFFIALIAYAFGRGLSREKSAAMRSMRQIKEDINTVREKLS